MELSRICGVRWEWLVAGDGSMTQEEESELKRRLPNTARAVLSRHFPLQEGLHTGEMEMVWEAVAGYFRWMRGEAKEGSLSNDDQLKAAETVAKAIIAPLEELQMGDVSPERMMIFVSLLSTAILALIPPEIRRYKNLEKGPREGLMKFIDEGSSEGLLDGSSWG